MIPARWRTSQLVFSLTTFSIVVIKAAVYGIQLIWRIANADSVLATSGFTVSYTLDTSGAKVAITAGTARRTAEPAHRSAETDAAFQQLQKL
jgi:hypothetical protein